MKQKVLFKFYLLVVILGSSLHLFSQACSVVPFNITDRDSICNGTCATITASLPTLRLTTSYVGGAIPYVASLPCEGGGIAAPGSIRLDDIHSTVIPIGFDFCFFGNTYTQCVISANGYISFNTALAGLFSPWAFTTGVPGGAVPEVRNSIMGPYQDIDPSVGFLPTYITYQTIGTAPWRAFVVKFDNIPMFSCTGLRHTSKVVMYETTNIIETYMTNKPICPGWNGGRAIQGIQNAAGTVAYTVPGRNATVWAAVNDAYRWIPNGAQMPVQIYWYPVLSPGAPLASDTTVALCPSLPGPFPTAIQYYARAVILDSCTTSLRRVDSLSLFDTTTVYVIGAYVTPYFRTDTIRCSQDSIRLDAGPLGLQHAWIPLPTSPTRYKWVSSAGTYICFKFTDLDRCFLDSVVITVHDAPPLADSVLFNSPVRCRGDSSGYVVMAHWNNSGRVRYGLDGAIPVFGDTIRNIWAGNHYVIALDSFDCRDSIPFIMTESPSVLISLDTLKDASCFGTNTGRIRISVTGGTAPYIYLWNTSIGSNYLPDIPAGMYIIAAIDSKACTAIDTFYITEPTPLVVDSLLADSTLCFASCDGSARVFASGSVPFSYGYNYNWSSGASTFNAAGLCGQTYFVTVTDSNSCQITDTILVPRPDLLQLNITAMNPITCNNGNDGLIILAGSGGSSGYTYSVDGVTYSPTTILSGFSAGSQTVRIRDTHFCLDDSIITFANPLRILPIISSIGPEACAGASNGFVGITPTNGSPGYRYSIDNISYQVSNILDSLPQGNYTAYVRDTNNCIDSIPFTIARTTPLSVLLDSSSVTCNRGSDGAVLATVAGGTPNYQYSLNGGAYTNSSSFSALTQGIYTVRVRDTNLCSIMDSIRVLEPLRIAPTTSVSNVTCFGYNDATVTITPTNGSSPYSYAVDGGLFGTSNIISFLSPGLHTAYVRDRYLCVDSINFTVTQPAALSINLIASRNVSCYLGNNGLLRIAVTNGTRPYTYAWSSGSTNDSANLLIAGTYYVTVSDSNSCFLSDTFTITQPTLLTGTMSRLNVLCFGTSTGNASIAASGGTTPYTYLWNDALAQTTATATNLRAGTYTVTVTDILGCRHIDSITITQPDSLILSYTSKNITCFSGNDGFINASTIAGVLPYQYNIGGAWQSSGLFTGLTSGTYTLTVRDSNGCVKNTVITLTQPLRIIPTILSNTPTTCNGGSDGIIQIGTTNGTAPFQYSINNISYQVSNTFSGLSANNYRAYVRDSLGCLDSVNFTITQPAPLAMDIVPTQNKCHNDATGAVTISPRGGTAPYRYSIDGGANFVFTNSFSGLIAGTYNIVVFDRNNCSVTGSATLNNPSLFTINATGFPVQCWDSENGKIIITTSGGTPPYANFEYSQNGIVFNSGILPTFDNLPGGFYYVNAFDGNGCLATDTTTISRPPIDTFAFTIDSTTCYGAQYTDGSIIVSALANPPYTYTIDGGPSQNFGIFYGLAAGNHLIIATNVNGCVDSLVQFVPFPPPVIVDVVPDTVFLELGASQQVQVNVQNAINPNYVWSSLQGLSCNDCPNPIVSPYNDMIYTVRVYDNSHPLSNYECYGEATLYVMVEPHVKSYVPNAFTPGNADGINDLLLVYGEGIKKLKFTVYDRWGELLFESNRQDYGWDGTFKGKLLNPGVYVYFVEAEYLDSKREYYQGSVTLLK